MTPHPHAETLRAIADGKQMQSIGNEGKWQDCSSAFCLTRISHPAWKFRVKPEALTIWVIIYSDDVVQAFTNKPTSDCFLRGKAEPIAIKEITYTPGEGL